MINYIDAIIYGLIQGLSEFLPISSSAHLALLPYFLNIEDPGVFFDLSMHLGTAFSIIVYFRQKIFNLVDSAFDPESGERPLFFNMIFSTLVSFICIFIIKTYADEFGRMPLYMAINLIGFGFLFWIADQFIAKRYRETKRTLFEKFSIVESSLIGIAQSLAIFPGVSRSGITLTTARFLGYERTQGTEYSFLLALPIILAGFVYKLIQLDSFENFQLIPLTIGIFTSFFIGLLAIHYFLKIFQKLGSFAFFIYRVILGAVLLYWLAH